MSYTTVYETSAQNQIILLKNIFEQNNVRYKMFDETGNTNFALGVRVQVHNNDIKRAEALLRENGFLEDPAPGQSSVSMAKFWLWLVIALVCLIFAAFLINLLMQE
ncbi:putative signal transducing protein [Salinimicrobium sp. CAU 1759]